MSAAAEMTMPASPERDGNRRGWLLPTLFALLAGLPYLLVNQLPGPDSAHFYLPLARAFAEGRWEAAFFPMIPPLFPMLAGMAAWAGLPVLVAGRLVSLGCFVLAVPLAYGLFRRLYGERIARCSAWLVAIHPMLIRHSGNAGVDSLKMVLLLALMLCLAAYLDRRRWRWLAAAGAGVGLATLARSESPVFAVLIVAVPMWTAWRQEGTPLGRRLAGGVAAAAIALAAMTAVLLPWIAWEHAHTGYWVTDTRQLLIAAKAGLVTREEAVASFMRLPPVSERLGEPLAGRPPGAWVEGLLDGIGWLNLVLLAAWAGWFWRQGRKWTIADSALLGGFLLNLLAFAVTGLVTKRYVSAATPFLAGWGAIGFLAVYDWVRARLPARRLAIVHGLTGLAMAVCVWDGTNGARPSLDPAKRAEARLPEEIGAAIRQLGTTLAPRPPLPFAPQVYRNGRRPVVLGGHAKYAFAAEAGHVLLPTLYVNTHRGILQLCDDEQVDLVVVDDTFLARVDDPESLLGDTSRFAPTGEWPVRRGTIRLYRYLGTSRESAP